MVEAKDFITSDNVVDTWTENKNICFRIKNGFKVKLNPNDVPMKRSAVQK
jgi:hypothetical protein